MSFIVYLLISAIIVTCVIIIAIHNNTNDSTDDLFETIDAMLLDAGLPKPCAKIKVNVRKFLEPQINKSAATAGSRVISLTPSHNPNPKLVLPSNTPLYVKRGWCKDDNDYTGYYRTRFGAWRGWISKRADIFKVYIFDPPIDQIKKHSRWPCFHDQGKDKWLIHLAINPKDGDVNAIISYVENLLVESSCK